MGPVLVFGHRNPDNDSICSAVAYAHLKNLADPHDVYVPGRLGPVPPETAYVFDRFGLEIPEEVGHVRTRVRDIMTEKPFTAAADETLREVGERMREHAKRAMPVIGDDERVIGLISERVLAGRYLDESEIAGFAERPVRADRLARALDGCVLAGAPDTELAGGVRLAASEPATVARLLEAGDTLIVGDRQRTQPLALASGAACLVLTNGSEPASGVLESAEERGAVVISTPHDSYFAARLVSLAHTAAEVMDPDVLRLAPDALLSEAAEELLGSKHRAGAVVDARGRAIGVVTRTNLARPERRRVILVDHNEASHSAEGVEDANVIEIVDHHRVGDIQTHGPILFLNMPVGSTATIVAGRYRELGVEIPHAIAGLLLSAILTDTVLLKSPTATSLDREAVDALATIAGVEPREFGMELFRAKSAGQPLDPARIVAGDLKEYRIGDMRLAIGQHETVDLAGAMERFDEIEAAMEALRLAERYDVVVLMLTDIVAEGSRIAAVGSVRPVERALGISLADGPAWMPGVLSRKSQVMARLAEAIGA